MKKPQSAMKSNALFKNELDILEQAERIALQPEKDQARLLQHYNKLVSDYKKLLKASMKISRISDIQGRTLKNQEQQIKQANESLHHMEQLRRELISDISHELGTPMMAVRGYLKAVLAGDLEIEPAYLHLIYDKLELMNQLIEDLFQLSAIKAGQHQLACVDLSVRELVDRLCRLFVMDTENNGIQLSVQRSYEEAAAEQLMLKADPLRIEQVTGNLVNNALKYSEPGTQVCLRFSMEEKAREGTTWLKTEVIDQGMGIEESDIPFIFDRLYRGKNLNQTMYKGSGLGLPICKEIIQNHQGEIGVSSQSGKGSIFYYKLQVIEKTR